MLPLTMDCDRNPFRCQSESFCNSEYLFHAMIAISSHHFWRERGDKSLFTKIQLHKSKAVQLFRQSLTSSVLQCSYLIDTLLIFITLDVSLHYSTRADCVTKMSEASLWCLWAVAGTSQGGLKADRGDGWRRVVVKHSEVDSAGCHAYLVMKPLERCVIA